MSYSSEINYVSGRKETVFFFDSEEKDSFLQQLKVKYKSNKSSIVEVDNNGQPIFINLNNVESITKPTNNINKI